MTALRDDGGWPAVTNDERRAMCARRYAMRSMCTTADDIRAADERIVDELAIYSERMASRRTIAAAAPGYLAEAAVKMRRKRDDAAIKFVVALLAWVQT